MKPVSRRDSSASVTGASASPPRSATGPGSRGAAKGPRYPDAGVGSSRSVGYAYVGRYIGGGLGWFLPQFLSGQKDRADTRHVREAEREGACHGEFVLCRITVEEIPNHRKRHIPARVSKSGGRP